MSFNDSEGQGVDEIAFVPDTETLRAYAPHIFLRALQCTARRWRSALAVVAARGPGSCPDSRPRRARVAEVGGRRGPPSNTGGAPRERARGARASGAAR